MNNSEAKFILQAYRPGGRDANDPAMAEALAQAARDPELGAWLAREQAHGKAVAARLREIEPPAGLRDAILAGGKATGRKGSAQRTWWARSAAWLPLAAAAAIVLGLTAWWRLAPVRGATMEEFAVNFVGRGFMLQKHSADLAALKTWLGEKNGPLPEVLPAKFAELHALGCRTLDFRGRGISLVCFERGGKEFHVFVARRDGASSAPDGAPQFLDHGKLAAATWADSKNRYVLVSDAGIEALRQLL
jgi:hypothetical protein